MCIRDRHMDTDGIISRLGALFRKTDTSWIEVDFSRWGSTNPDKEKFEMIKRAVINLSLIHIWN